MTLNISKLRRRIDNGVFRDFEFSHYTISYEGIELWVCNGFSCFRDYGNSRPFLSELTRRERKFLWREYKRELRERAIKNITELLEDVEVSE